jgi:hypothetical protein
MTKNKKGTRNHRTIKVTAKPLKPALKSLLE